MLSLSWNDRDAIRQNETCQVSSSSALCAVPLFLFESLYQTLSLRTIVFRRDLIYSVILMVLLPEALSLLPKSEMCVQTKTTTGLDKSSAIWRQMQNHKDTYPELLIFAGHWKQAQVVWVLKQAIWIQTLPATGPWVSYWLNFSESSFFHL